MFHEEMRAVTEAKNADYSAGSGDAMDNYHAAAEFAGVTAFQAWMVLFYKHVSALKRFARDGELSSESIHGRFVDVANYAGMGDALVKDLAAKITRSDSGSRQSPIVQDGHGFGHPRTKKDILEARRTMSGCCDRFADQQSCDCLENALEDF